MSSPTEIIPLPATAHPGLVRNPVHGAHDLDDHAALTTWLAIFRIKSTATEKSYRSQTSKFRMFLHLLHPERPANRQLQLATEQDVAMYEAALLHRAHNGLTLPGLILSEEQMQLFQLRRQPFAQPLKRSSANQAIAVIHAMYDFMCVPNAAMPQPYVQFNPARRVLKASSRTPRKIDRVLPIEALEAMRQNLLATIATARAAHDEVVFRHAERGLWMMTLLFGLWGRREETVKLTMGDFVQGPDRKWSVRLLRKGQREQDIAVPDWVIEGLRRYRTSLGLPTDWPRGDTTPVLLDVRHTRGRLARHLSAHTLYTQIKEIALEAAQEVAEGVLLPDLNDQDRQRIIDQLKNCSPHWFRHTGPTIAINNGMMTLPDASNLLGHASTATTSMMYHHADEQKTRSGLEQMGRALGFTFS